MKEPWMAHSTVVVAHAQRCGVWRVRTGCTAVGELDDGLRERDVAHCAGHPAPAPLCDSAANHVSVAAALVLQLCRWGEEEVLTGAAHCGIHPLSRHWLSQPSIISAMRAGCHSASSEYVLRYASQKPCTHTRTHAHPHAQQRGRSAQPYLAQRCSRARPIVGRQAGRRTWSHEKTPSTTLPKLGLQWMSLPLASCSKSLRGNLEAR